MASTLNDSDYVILHNVPIVDAHSAPGRMKPFDNMNESLLQRIVEVNNRRLADTGDEIPIVAHHTEKGRPADEQPPIIGFAKGLYLAPFGELNPRPAIYARDWKIRKEYVELARSRPRRSIEIWPDNLEIDPIALCGADTPARHLGTLKFHRTEKVEILSPLKFAKDGIMDGMQDDGLVQKFLAAFFETPIGKVLMDMANERGFEQEGNEERSPTQSMVNAPPATSAQGFAEGTTPDTMPMPPYTPPKAEGFDHREETPGPGGTHEPSRIPDPDKEGSPMPMEGAAGSTYEHGGTPYLKEKRETYGMMGKYAKSGDPGQVEKLRMEHDDTKLQYRKLEEQFGAEQQYRQHLEKKIDAINLQLNRATYLAKLTQLRGEGYQFSRSSVIDRVQHMTPEQFDKEVEFMKENFQRAPIGLRIQEKEPFMREGGEELAAQQFSREELKTKASDTVRQAQRLSKSKGLSLTDAYEEIVNQKT